MDMVIGRECRSNLFSARQQGTELMWKDHEQIVFQAAFATSTTAHGQEFA